MLWMGSVAEWSKALDLSIYLTPSGENPREFEPRRYQRFSRFATHSSNKFNAETALPRYHFLIDGGGLVHHFSFA